MRDRYPVEPRVLTESQATRLLQRASELDAARSAHLQLAELRSAATQAGISAGAFDAALEELQQADARASTQPSAPPQGRTRWRRVALSAVAVVGMLVMFASMRVVPAAEASAVEEVFLLRCLSPTEARTFIAPILRRSGAAYTPANAQRVLVVRGSQAQIDDVRSTLDQLEGSSSTACTARPVTPSAR